MADDKTVEQKRSGIVELKHSVMVGNLEPFDVERPAEWGMYVERFDLYCLTNGLADSAKTAVLMTIGGKALYQVAASVVSPDKVVNVKFRDLMTRLTRHFVPGKTVWTARFEFHRRTQGPDESANNYMAALQRLANECNFQSLLDSMLISQFICGLRDEAVQRRLLVEDENTLTKAKALETASIAESTRAQQQEMREEKVMAVRQDTRGEDLEARGPKCQRCGGQHSDSQCKFREADCHACGRTGHIARMCRNDEDSSERWARNRHQGSWRNKVKAINNVRGGGNPERATVTLGKRTLEMEVDSGSPFTLVSMRTFQSLFPGRLLQRTGMRIKDYQGRKILVSGDTVVDVTYGNRRVGQLPLIVVSCDAPAILGRNWFVPLGIYLQGTLAGREGVTFGKGKVCQKSQMMSSPELQISGDGAEDVIPEFQAGGCREEELDRGGQCSPGGKEIWGKGRAPRQREDRVYQVERSSSGVQRRPRRRPRVTATDGGPLVSVKASSAEEESEYEDALEEPVNWDVRRSSYWL